MSSDSSVSTAPVGSQRRVGRVEKWLPKGFGFAVDHGRLDTSGTPNTGLAPRTPRFFVSRLTVYFSFGWVADEFSGSAIFIYHTNLVSDQAETFHRLFANEWIEYNVDFSQPQREGRSQATRVTGIAGSKLLCDLNLRHDDSGSAGSAAPAAPASSGTTGPTRSRSTTRKPQAGHGQSNNGNGRSNRNNRSGSRGNGSTVQYIYYVQPPATPGGPGPSGTLSASGAPEFMQGLQFPPLAPVQSSEPAYITPTNGIPVPK
jgi:hypothetical protein